MDDLWTDQDVMRATGTPENAIREWITAGAVAPVRGGGGHARTRGWDRDGVERLAVLGACYTAGHSAPVALAIAAAVGMTVRVPDHRTVEMRIYDGRWIMLAINGADPVQLAQLVDRGRLVRVSRDSPLGRAMPRAVPGSPEVRVMVSGVWWRCYANALRVQVMPGVVMPAWEPYREGIVVTTVDLSAALSLAIRRLAGEAI